LANFLEGLHSWLRIAILERVTTTPLSPATCQRILASELRRLRAGTGKTQVEIEQLAHLGHGSLSRYESNSAMMPVTTVEKLFTIYEVDEEHLGRMIMLAKAARKRRPASDYQGLVPADFEEMLVLERDASRIEAFSLRAIPGLLQTEAYAHALISAASFDKPVDHLVQARLDRAKLFERENPVDYWGIIWEPALDTMIGSPAIMLEQLEHLKSMAQRNEITLQVLPASFGGYPFMLEPYTVFSFADAPEGDVAYFEHHTRSLYLDDPAEVTEYRRVYRHLIKAALNDQQTAECLEARIGELKIGPGGVRGRQNVAQSHP
jgi:transcriptional regulator with XRE-family HTH domain